MIKRKSFIQRSTKPIARSRIKRKPRPAGDFKRIYGSKKRVEFVKELGCIYCRMTFGGFDPALEQHNAHTENGGRGRKADHTTIIPLCAPHHRMYDEHQAPLASDFIRQKLKDYAAETENLWQSHIGAE